MSPNGELVTTGQAAKLLGITASGVRHLILTGQLTCQLSSVPAGRGQVRLIKRHDVERLKKTRDKK